MRRCPGRIAAAAVVATSAAAAGQTPVTVADIIGITWFGSDPHNGGIEYDAHELSPDGTRLAVVLQRGNMARNTVDYALVLVPLTDTDNPRVDTLVTMSSGSNDPGISGVRWLADNRSIVFLGTRGKEPAQLYSIDITSHTLTQRTHSKTGVTTFEVAAGGTPIVFQQRGALDTTTFADRRAHGFALSEKTLLNDAIVGDWDDSGPAYFTINYPKTYWLARGASVTSLAMPDPASGFKDCELRPDVGPPMGTDADALLVVCNPVITPRVWETYKQRSYRYNVEKFKDFGRELVRLNLRTGKATLVLAAPLPDEGSYRWAPDGRSILLTNAMLPLSGPDSARRTSQTILAEIDLATGRITEITARDSLFVQHWDARTGVVDAAVAPAWWRVTNRSPHLYFRKTSVGWRQLSTSDAAKIHPLAVRLEQGMNAPPRLLAVNIRTGMSHVLLDANPGLLTQRRFGPVQVFHWSDAAGHRFFGTLYYPPDYVAGRRYPLVIQTHGVDSTRFMPDGVFTTDEAAQVLANAGVIVFQTLAKADTSRAMAESMETPDEAPFVQRAIEAAIDSLVSQGLVDRGKIGMQGFSRTCFYTLFFLTHSSYPMAAATIADGVDYSYFQMLAFRESNGVNGGLPWGATQAQWLQRAPGFRLDRVTAPLRITAIQPFSLIQEWEPYAGLRLLKKPAELIYLPEGSHVLVKPWERMTSQQGVVDWWRFWLQGYEDPDPAKTAQYARWRELRAERDAVATPTHP